MAALHTLPRGTRSSFTAKAAANGLVPWQVYLITDESRIVVALTTSTSIDFAKLSEAGGSSVAAKIEIFNASGTFTLASGAKTVTVSVLSGGGGGAGGTFAATGAAALGGGGGSGGSRATELFVAALLTATVAVTVGAGGVGGAARLTAGQNSGNNGVASSFGGFLIASPGLGAVGGAAGAANVAAGNYPGNPGAAATANVAGSPGPFAVYPTGAPGGASGGSASINNGFAGGGALLAGPAMFTGTTAPVVSGAGPAASGSTSGNATSATAQNANFTGPGGAGGGGGATITTSGGNGGNGALGGGGGGGGACAFTSSATGAGAGGTGGAGRVIIVTEF